MLICQNIFVRTEQAQISAVLSSTLISVLASVLALALVHKQWDKFSTGVIYESQRTLLQEPSNQRAWASVAMEPMVKFKVIFVKRDGWITSQLYPLSLCMFLKNDLIAQNRSVPHELHLQRYMQSVMFLWFCSVHHVRFIPVLRLVFGRSWGERASG